MFREELYSKLKDVKHDFIILKNRVNCYLEEQNEILSKLDKVNNECVITKEKASGSYGLFVINDIVQNVKFMESELCFVENNKEDILRIELSEHIYGLDERIKIISNKFKQLNLDIKEAFYFEALKEKAKK